jgi:hypothetical protein
MLPEARAILRKARTADLTRNVPHMAFAEDHEVPGWCGARSTGKAVEKWVAWQ